MDEIVEFASKPAKGQPWDVAIIGSGPAALSAAIYTTRGAASSIILGGEAWGGQLMLTTQVDNFPGFPEGVLGPDLMAKMRKQAERFGAEFVQRNVTSVDFSKKPFGLKVGDKDYSAKSIIVATGALTRWLGIPGEDTLRGKGVSSCAPCDAPFFKGKKVVVVGGGDAAMEEALVLTKYASSVTIIHRRSEFRASEAMQKKVFANPKIKILWNSEVTQIIGDKKLEKIKIKNIKDGSEKEMKLDGLFVAIGHKPDSDIFKGPIETDEKGYIVVHNHTNTSLQGVFVAGDVHDGLYKQAVTAAGFGCMAGLEVLKYLDQLAERDTES